MKTHLDLFSGIGGFKLAAEWNGLKTIGFCETDEYANTILKKHWPEIENFGDVRNIAVDIGEYPQCECCDDRWCERHQAHLGECPCITPMGWELDRERPYLITAGWPCQPFSVAGKQRGRHDDRALWPQVLRIVEALQPRLFLGENVPGIIGMELDTVLSDLEGVGYSCGAFDIPASGIGAYHRRHRVWVVAHSLQERGCRWKSERCDASDAIKSSVDSETWRLSFPNVHRTVDGISGRLVRIGAIGNAIVPQIAAHLIKMMIQHDTNPDVPTN